jgi:glutaminyl-tRNA synthetase
MASHPKKAEVREASNFIEELINEDIRAGRVPHYIHTRFPPEPNGYLHIGHVKALCIDFGIAEKYEGLCNLRFDDTNPTKEDPEYVEAIQQDIRWLGFDWNGGMFYGSDYFEETYAFAVKLIKKGLAYVDELAPDEMREYRGTLTEPGRNSPWRDRPVEENLRLFEEMRAGRFSDGELTLRAKIDMASPNVNLRDPVLYRIRHVDHYRSGKKWCIYPMYDFAHPIQDALEGITHSLCSLEYEDHRPLYDWVIQALEFDPAPRQIEFARLNITGTIMSKRYLRRLVEEGRVDGWDDPRMPTLCGLRRRGCPPEAIRDFISRAGVAKADSTVDMRLLEHCMREQLNETAPRAMAVLEPLRVVITNYPEGHAEMVEAENHPKRPEMGVRELPFSREIYIERSDFAENPPPKFHRLKPGGEVRLKNAYIIRCDEVIRSEAGEIVELRCSYDPDSKSGGATAGRKVKGTLHWVDAGSCVQGEVRVYDTLMLDEQEAGEGAVDIMDRLNPNSLTVYADARLEPSLATAEPGTAYQFMRQGYFAADPSTTPEKPVFNRTVSLKESYKVE